MLRMYIFMYSTGYFTRRKNSSVCSIICWMWNINNLSTYYCNSTGVLQVNYNHVVVHFHNVNFMILTEIHCLKEPTILYI